LQAADHHARGSSAKYSEEAEVLHVDEGKGRKANDGAELAERELSTQGAKERQEPAISEGEASCVD